MIPLSGAPLEGFDLVPSAHFKSEPSVLQAFSVYTCNEIHILQAYK